MHVRQWADDFGVECPSYAELKTVLERNHYRFEQKKGNQDGDREQARRWIAPEGDRVTSNVAPTVECPDSGSRIGSLPVEASPCHPAVLRSTGTGCWKRDAQNLHGSTR